MIALGHLYKVYAGQIHALSNVDLKIARGEFVYLVGPSGAGKTTLFRMMTAYDKATSGVIEVAGYDLTKITESQVPFLRRKIGVVFQDFKLLSDRTVIENVALPLEVTAKMRPHEIQARVAEMLDNVGLKYKGKFLPEQLSGGEQQRVAVARALINKPDLLIADEPTGNLDQELSEGIMSLFAKINAQGTTVVVATHNHSLINRGNRRVIRLERGRVVNDL